MAATDVTQGLQEFFTTDTETLVHRQQQMLDRQEVVLEVLAVTLGVVEHVVEFAIHARLFAAIRLGQLGHGFVGLVANHQRRQTELRQNGRNDCVVLARDGCHHVIGGDLRIGEGLGLIECGRHRFLGLVGPLLRVDCHDRYLLRWLIDWPRLTTANDERTRTIR